MDTTLHGSTNELLSFRFALTPGKWNPGLADSKINKHIFVSLSLIVDRIHIWVSFYQTDLFSKVINTSKL